MPTPPHSTRSRPAGPHTPFAPSPRVFTKARTSAPLPPRQVYFGLDAGWQETPILRRSDLETPRQGPCIVEEYDATVVIPPDSKAELDAYGNILIALL